MKTEPPVQRIALTPGEPAGIGPDLCVQLSQQKQSCEIVMIADPELLIQRAAQLKQVISINLFDASKKPQINTPGSITVLPVSLKHKVICSQLNADNSTYVVETIRMNKEN